MNRAEWDPVFRVVDKHVGIHEKSVWINQMDKVVEEVGDYVDVKAHWPELSKDRLKYENDLLRWNSLEAISGLLKMFKDEEGRKEVQDSRDLLAGEIASGKKVFGSSVIIVIGRKPQ